MEISLICLYNDKKKLEEQLLQSIRNNEIECELILIDNSKNTFSSAAKALNYGAAQATKNILIFSHQDVYIKQGEDINLLAKDIYDLPIGSIVGAFGAREREKEIISNSSIGETFSGRIVHNINTLQEVSCVDEAFFGMKKETYEALKFNEELCFAWDLYAVEMCLHARSIGGKVFVHPIQLHHFSWGRITRNYMRCLFKLSKAYKKRYKYIWTTCYKVKNSRIILRMRYMMWYINRKIKKGRLD